ncbi:unnamed protein product [Tuber aestivum]|uniref:Uncharacterized protein n=1 Tax=Tuber aestivum TaxID=59557 RepID=A0A292PVU2_9PEZI|nr:unnamed protein product [Tuber aestivum]
MAMPTNVARCVASFSSASLGPAAILRRGLTVQLYHRFLSASGKDRQAAVGMDCNNRRMGAGNFVNTTGPKPAEVSVGNGLMADVMVLPSTSTLTQTTIMGQGSQPIYHDMQATASTVPRVLGGVLSVCLGLYRSPYLCVLPCGWGAAEAVGVAYRQCVNLIGALPQEMIKHMPVLDLSIHLQDEEHHHGCLPNKTDSLIKRKHSQKVTPTDTIPIPIVMANNEIVVMQPKEETERLGQKNAVFFSTHGAQSVGNIPVDLRKYHDGLTSSSGCKVYGPQDNGACNTHHKQIVRINLLITGSSGERGLHSGTHTYSRALAFGESHRIAQEANECACTSISFLPQNSISSSTMPGYIHKRYHNKQPKQFTRALWTMGHHNADRKTSKPEPPTKDSGVGIQKDNWKEVPNTKADKQTGKNRRNLKWVTAYSKMTIHEAQDRLGIRLDLDPVPVRRMLEGKRALLVPDMILKLKRKIYQDLANYIQVGGYPTEASADFREGHINDIVAFTICPIIGQFNHVTKQKLRLAREKVITAVDSATGGMEEFVVMDYISHNQEGYVLVVEAKKASLGEALKQCFLSLKDMRDYNGRGTVYGFVTMGDSWRMISFDGEFTVSQKIELLFESMGAEGERWMADYSILVECLNVALSNGGKDLAEVV